MLADLVSTGRIADVALVVLAAEVALLLGLRAALGRGPAIAPILWNAGAGAGLLLALRAALVGGGAIAVLALLALAGVCHAGEASGRWASLADRRRHRGGVGEPPPT